MGKALFWQKTVKKRFLLLKHSKQQNRNLYYKNSLKNRKVPILRVIVVDGVVIAAMKRQCKAGDFRSNLHRGGTSESLQLNYEEEAIALKAAKALKMGVCGVDILQSERGPLVLEVNSTPGLEGIEKTTQKNISKSIIGYIERNKR